MTPPACEVWTASALSEPEKISVQTAHAAPTKNGKRGARDVRMACRRARKNRAIDEPLCALARFDAKKSKRIVARQLRTDKVFVYFT
jgi:hypothetical protein